MAYKESVEIRKKSCEVKKKTFLIEKYHFSKVFQNPPDFLPKMTKNENLDAELKMIIEF